MKKVLYTTIICFAVGSVTQAQITKGKMLVGGTIVYSQGKAENSNNINYIPTKQHYVSINPAVGKVIKENLVVGLQANFLSRNQNNENPVSKSKTENYGGGVFLRKYIPLLKNFYFFGHAAAGYNKSKTSQTYMGRPYGKAEGWDINASAYPGLAYAITKKFHIEAGLNDLAVVGYSHSEFENTDLATGSLSSSKGNNFSISTSLGSNAGFNIGFRLLL